MTRDERIMILTIIALLETMVAAMTETDGMAGNCLHPNSWNVELTPSVTAYTTEPECTLEELNGCLQSLMSVTKGNDFTFGSTRLQLLAVCSTLKDSVYCVDEHMKLCFNPTQRKVYNHVVSGARQVLAELCVPGPIQEAYLTHAPCYKNITLAEEKCAPKYRHLIEISENVNEEHNVDEGLKDSCCAFREFVLCKYIYVAQDCGHDADAFLQQHLDRITNSLLHEHCAHYTYGAGTCTSISNHLRAALSLPMILTLSLSIERILRRFLLQT